VTPGVLPAELTEAMDSPLAATRFGVVDELRERLAEADLGQAYAAWLALERMAEDDSRKVSDAARRAVGTAAPQVPAAVELGADGAGGFTLTGPPIALAAIAAAVEGWLAVEQDGAEVRLVAALDHLPGPGTHEAAVVVRGPTGEAAVTVLVVVPEPEPEPVAVAPEPEPVAVAPEPEPVAVAPEPEPEPEPLAVATARPEPEPRAKPEPAAAAPAAGDGKPSPTPWWAVAALVAGAAALVVLNLPPQEAETVQAWYNDDQGWYVYRSWHDVYIISSVVALLAAAGARLVRELAGVAVGAALFLVVSALVYLGAGIADTQISRWAATFLVGVGMTAALWYGLRPRLSVRGPFRLAPTLLVVGGAVVNLAGALIPFSDTTYFEITSGLTILFTLSLVAFPWPLLGPGGDVPSRRLATALAATATALLAVSVIPAYTSGQTTGFLLGAGGALIVLAGIAAAAVPRPGAQP
jgi:hypothetical protein